MYNNKNEMSCYISEYILDNFRNFVRLKELNPNVKVLLAVGGWTEGSKKYSDMAKDPIRRAIFIRR